MNHQPLFLAYVMDHNLIKVTPDDAQRLTQIPYAALTAGCCAVGYLLAGFILNPWIPLVVSTVLLVTALFILSRRKAI